MQPKPRSDDGGVKKAVDAAPELGRACWPHAQCTAAVSSIAGCTASCCISISKLTQLNGHNIGQIDV